MPVIPLQPLAGAAVPCSHCNAGNQGPEAGICHRGLPFSNDASCDSCLTCVQTNKPSAGLAKRLIVAGLGRTPCSFCGGKGYRTL